MEALGDVEWQAYKSHALAEHSVIREAHEEALREAGHSCFFNSRVRQCRYPDHYFLMGAGTILQSSADAE